MESTIEEVNSVQKRVKVEVKVDLVNDAFADAYKSLQKKAQVRGFRPGKTPLNIIKKMYGQSVAADVADKLIKQHLFDAIEKNELKPISSPALDTVDLPKQGEQYAFSAVIDVMPELKLSDYKDVPVTCHKHEYSADLVDQELDGLRKSHAKKKAADEGAVAKVGMIATLSHSGKVGDEDFLPFKAEKVPVEIGASQTHPDIDKVLPGMKVGDSKEISIKLSEDFQAADYAGKVVDLKLSIDSLEELTLPELDDEFAKDLGAEGLEQVRKNIETHLKTNMDRNKKSELEQGILSHIVEKNNFDVPPTMVNSVIDDMIEQMKWPNDKEKKQAKADPEFRKNMIDQAKQRAKNTLILWEVAKVEKLEVSDEDVDAHIGKMFLQGQAPSEEDEKHKELIQQMKKSMGQNLKDNLLFEKSLDFLIDNAKVTLKDDH